MKSLDVNDLKRIELEILEHIDAFCKLHNISYFLDSGTLLGSVRHEGFIPWDDDIDILMPRDDYEKFKKIFAKDNSHYKLLTYDTRDDYYYLFGKVVDTNTELIEDIGRDRITDFGVYVDIFPIDGLPDNRIAKWFLRKKLWLLRAMWDDSLLNKPRKNGLLRKIRYSVSRFIGWRKLCKMIDNSVKKWNYKNVKYCGNIIAASKIDRQVRSEAFSSKVLLPFEGKQFYAPVGYKEYLTELYGDYMKLPPKEKQVSNHVFKAYIK